MHFTTADRQTISKVLAAKPNENVFVLFYGTWCEVCMDVVPEVVAHFETLPGQCEMYIVAVENEDRVWAEDEDNDWNLKVVPTFRVYRGLEHIEWEHAGAIKPKKLENILKKYLSKK